MTCSCARKEVDAFPDEPTEMEASVLLYRSVLLLHPELAVSACGAMIMDEEGNCLGATALSTLMECVGAQA